RLAARGTHVGFRAAELGLPDVNQSHAGPRAREQQRAGAADAGRRAGDDRHPALQRAAVSETHRAEYMSGVRNNEQDVPGLHRPILYLSSSIRRRKHSRSRRSSRPSVTTSYCDWSTGIVLPHASQDVPSLWVIQTITAGARLAALPSLPPPEPRLCTCAVGCMAEAERHMRFVTQLRRIDRARCAALPPQCDTDAPSGSANPTSRQQRAQSKRGVYWRS